MRRLKDEALSFLILLGVVWGIALMGIGGYTATGYLFDGSDEVAEAGGLPPDPGCVHYEIADGVYFEKCALPDGVTCYVHVPPFGMTGIAMWCER